MDNPIEITEKDLIERSLTAPGAIQGVKPNTGSVSWIQKLRDAKNMINEIKGMASEMGIDLSKLNMPGAPTGMSGATNSQGLSQFLNLMMLQYGDITVADLLERLKTQYGTKKLSQFLGGGLLK